MKIYNLTRIIFFLSIFFLMFTMSCSTGKIVPQEVGPDYMIFSIGKSGLEIKGILKNYSEARTLFVDSETHISMADENQKVGLKLTSDGNMIVDDESIPHSTINRDGSFSFKYENLPEGNYIFIIQPLLRVGHVSLVDLRTLEPLKLTISNSGPATNFINVGQVNIGTP